MPVQSAGILLYRFVKDVPEFFLVHPGGPFWAKKDAGAWTVPKGEFTPEEDPLEAAKREFLEETGISLSGNFISLTPLKQKSGKIIHAFALQGDIDPIQVKSNMFSIEWPPRSGKMKEFPEIDRAAWFNLKEAEEKINPGQWPFIVEWEHLSW